VADQEARAVFDVELRDLNGDGRLERFSGAVLQLIAGVVTGGGVSTCRADIVVVEAASRREVAKLDSGPDAFADARYMDALRDELVRDTPAEFADRNGFSVPATAWTGGDTPNGA